MCGYEKALPARSIDPRSWMISFTFDHSFNFCFNTSLLEITLNRADFGRGQ